MKSLEKLSQTVNRMTGYLIVAIFSIMIAACVLQVFTRYVLNNSLPWTEEMARFAFIWSNMLGAAVCVSKGSHATVTAVFDLFPQKVQRLLSIFQNLVVLGVAFVMVYFGCHVTYMTRLQKSPALGLNMALINFAVPLCGAFILLHAALHIINSVAQLKNGGDPS